MRFRKLRIAFSATCLIACVLLIALWVRSYWYLEWLGFNHLPNVWDINSQSGEMFVSRMDDVPGNGYPGGWFSKSEHITSATPPPLTVDGKPPFKLLGFYMSRARNGLSLFVPYWFLVLSSTVLAAVPWLPWWSNRFSLRTLLIATTLVAVALGLAVYAARN